MNQDNRLIVVVKRECPTCELVESVLHEIDRGTLPLYTLVQDDADYSAGGLKNIAYDETLEQSWILDIEFVPTLVRIEAGKEVARIYGWDKAEWRRISGQPALGAMLPDMRPGCGSMTLNPGMPEQLAVRFGNVSFKSRQVELGDEEDAVEACFDRGWSDGLPVVPPTRERVLTMLAGTSRQPDEFLGLIPPELNPCTVEKVAINAVLAGCKPEYMPVVLATLEAALDEDFAMHGLLCTTHFAGPVVVVNGPIAKAVGMNSGHNALGQGNRANACIGRTLQLIVRNVGGGRPGEIDRSTLGNPGKYTFCFAEAEHDSWEPLSMQHGLRRGASAVTVYAGAGLIGILDQKSRTPESLLRSVAASLRAVEHTKIAMRNDALVIMAPEHADVFINVGWSKARVIEELETLLELPGEDMIEGAGGIEYGMPADMAGRKLAKFRKGGIMLVRAGGTAGKFSAIVPSWAAGPSGSVPVTKEVVA